MARLDEDSFRQRIKESLLVSFVLSSILFFFGPSHVYFYNVLEFSYTYKDIFLTLVVLTLVSTAAFSILSLAAISRATLHKRVMTFLFSLCVLFWVQGNMLLWDYGLLNGKEIVWGGKTYIIITESLIWLLILAYALLRYTSVYRLFRIGCIAIFLIQTVSLGLVALRTESPSWTRYELNEESKFRFSRETNVIMLLIDTFQTDVFQELLDSNSELRKRFSGFTYFRNAMGGYLTTYPSLPLILTGQYYDNSIPIQDYIKRAYMKDSLPRVLMQKGYDVFLPIKSSFYCSEQVASSYRKKKDVFKFIPKESFSLLTVTFFRHVPHYGKKAVFSVMQNIILDHSTDMVNVGTPFDNDTAFLFNLLKKSEATLDKNTFKFYYLRGLHEPLVLNEKLEYEKMPQNRQSYKRTAIAELTIANMMFDVLKKLGIYDSSLIIVLADHGTGKPEANSWVSEDNMGYVNPLILIKPAYAQGELSISDAPVTLADIPATVLNQLGYEVDSEGADMFALDPSMVRKRYYYSYDWSYDNWRRKYFTILREFAVVGHSWKRASWNMTFRNLLPGKVEIVDNSYRYETRLSGNESLDRFVMLGWDNESIMGARRALGTYASMAFDVPRPGTDLELEAEISPIVGKQHVKVSINGDEVAIWNVDRKALYRARVPEKLLTEGFLKVAFEMPDAQPLENTPGTYQEMYSISLSALTLRKL